MDKVFPNSSVNYTDVNWIRERATLAPANEAVDKLNDELLQKLKGTSEITFRSNDTTVDQNQAVQYPTEFLNTVRPIGMPPNNLTVKLGAPLMLLRNLDPPRLYFEHCNATRLMVKKMMPHVIEATILSGCGKGEDVFIPRIALIPSRTEITF
uniref:DNA helicase Pif1-like 2B domain-containing protein n=1 Tax=Octopus bimaculoides TaxID=37653 RepID=A0A0L8IDB9_OCTBM